MSANRFHFRAWDGEKMISPDYIDRNGIAHWRENSIPTTSEILMQSTGLEDKNGKEIFEGDVVKHKGQDSYGTGLPNDTFEVDIISSVYWDYGMAQWSVRDTSSYTNFEEMELVDCDKPEVIGDIYSNPELLKG